ncbi:DUF354 domain-containing protein [Halorussus lipolyticus]|uniref:DUF354 domain-containing protein n=1 Tax=Halorussus lipolyticus TaxID=3034024 RepID=UPI0023E8DEBA|nr:DUF354 domain-containing protein [Halorussus sp. DT80]
MDSDAAAVARTPLTATRHNEEAREANGHTNRRDDRDRRIDATSDDADESGAAGSESNETGQCCQGWQAVNVVVTIQHPAHVHFFRPIIRELRARGDEVRVFAREKDVALDLLDHYGLDYTVLAGKPDSLGGLARVQATYEYRLWQAVRRFNPDVMTAIGGTAVAHVSTLVGAESVIWLDNEGILAHKLTTPFADVVATPRRFRDDFGAGHVRYDGFQELAYLHPDRFEADEEGLRNHGIDPDEDYAVVRFREWSALHDVGEAGFSGADKRRLVEALDDHGDVYVVSESRLPESFRDNRLPVPPHLVHDLLSEADLYVGDSATMSTEAALLGTPAVRCQSFADGEDMSNFVELGEEGLLYSTADGEQAVQMATTLARDDPEDDWERRQNRLLETKIDVVPFAIGLLVREGGGDGEPPSERPEVPETADSAVSAMD